MGRKPVQIAFIFPRTPLEVDVFGGRAVTGRPPPAGLHNASDEEVVIAGRDGEFKLEATGLLFGLDAIESIDFSMHEMEQLFLEREGEVLLLELLLVQMVPRGQAPKSQLSGHSIDQGHVHLTPLESECGEDKHIH